MHSQPSPGPDAPTLTDSQRSRLIYARQDLDMARTEDLARLDPANLILLVERLRGRLSDMLDLIEETTHP